MSEREPELYPDLQVHPAKQWAVGVPGILHSMEPALAAMGHARPARRAGASNHNKREQFRKRDGAGPRPPTQRQ